MLEEISFDYKISKVNLNEGEQHKPEFKKISPFNKIPVITDHENKKSIFESGAILMYLGEKSKMFYPENNRLEINQWLMAQMGLIGPMIGQHHQFHYYHQGKSDWGEKRYFKITKKRLGIGKRIFLMSPLHHHYQKRGIHETKIVARFWMVGILLAIISLATLKLR